MNRQKHCNANANAAVNARQLTHQTSTRGQNLAYSHDAAGQIVRIEDAGVGKTSSYVYDLSGRRLRERTEQGDITYQDNHLAYDALGRLRWVADTRAYLSIDYDKVGNRTHIHTSLRDHSLGTLLVDTPVEATSDRYFQYDAMNRQTVVNAADASGSLGAEGCSSASTCSNCYFWVLSSQPHSLT